MSFGHALYCPLSYLLSLHSDADAKGMLKKLHPAFRDLV